MSAIGQGLPAKSPLKAILRIAIPVSLQALISSSLSFVDIYMVSSLGVNNIAAVGLISKVYFVFIVALFGLTSGISILVAQYWGSDRKLAVNGLLFAGLMWVALVTVPLALLGFFASHPLAALLSPDAAVVQIADLYWRWTSPFILLTGISMVLATVQRSTGDSLWPMVASVIALLSNTGMNYLVLFGPIEALRIGMPGVALATNISRLLEVSLLLIVLIRHLRPTWVWQRQAIAQIWHQGKVLTIQEALWSAGIFAFFIVYSYMGPNELAAMSLLSPIENMLVDVFIGFGVATGILLGQHLGRNEFDEAWALNQYVLTRFPLAALVFAFVMMLLSQFFIAQFSGISESVEDLLLGVWLVYCLALPIKTHNLIAVIGVLRSGGDNPYVLRLELISIWLLALPLVALAGLYFGLPLWLVVMVTVAEEAAKVALFRSRINKRIWLKNLTIN
ncbi:MAG: MATE family efflux transporter [Reinekea forsetii]|nr:MATE family efflux transporter [Reinekea forsetii]